MCRFFRDTFSSASGIPARPGSPSREPRESCGILGPGDKIEAIPDRQIEDLRLLLSGGTECRAHPLLREGSWVRVKRGPLKNLEGLLVRAKNQARLVLSIALLSQSVSTEVDAGDVECLRPAAEGARRVA